MDKLIIISAAAFNVRTIKSSIRTKNINYDIIFQIE